jgi:hypothetical protein
MHIITDLMFAHIIRERVVAVGRFAFGQKSGARHVCARRARTHVVLLKPTNSWPAIAWNRLIICKYYACCQNCLT